MKKFFDIRRISTFYLEFIPLVLGFACCGFLVATNPASLLLQHILLILTFFFWGLSGLPMILRQESGIFPFFNGLPAFYIGLLTLLAGWFFVALMILNMMNE